MEEATDGIYAVQTIESMICNNRSETEMYDIIIADMIMNTLNGDETAKRIRAMKCLRKQPHIVALTANVLADDKNVCLEAGMCDFMSKPIKMDALNSLLAGASDGTLRCSICHMNCQ